MDHENTERITFNCWFSVSSQVQRKHWNRLRGIQFNFEKTGLAGLTFVRSEWVCKLLKVCVWTVCEVVEGQSETVREWEGDRERETETERTVKLNPNTPSHAIQNTVATGNTFTTHEPRYIPPNVGLNAVDFTNCYKFLWLRSVLFFAHIITAHSNSQCIVQQQQAIRFTSISVTYSSWYVYISFIHRICHHDVHTLGRYSWSHSLSEMSHEHGQRCRLRLCVNVGGERDVA